MSWTAATVRGFLNTGRITGMRDYHAKIRSKLVSSALAALPSSTAAGIMCADSAPVQEVGGGEVKPDCAHLVAKDFMHGISEYGNAPDKGGVYWPEVFLPLDPQAAKPWAARGAQMRGGGEEARWLWPCDGEWSRRWMWKHAPCRFRAMSRALSSILVPGVLLSLTQ